MTLVLVVKVFLALEAAWASLLVLLLVAAMVSRSAARREPDLPATEATILDALTTYLGGNRDIAQLKSLAAKHTLEVEEAILQLQSVIGGRRHELCVLVIELGYAQGWCHGAHSGDPAERQRAYSALAAMAHHEAIHRLIGSMPDKAFTDPDEQIRIEAGRILVRGGAPNHITRVFEGILTAPPRMRLLLAQELAHHSDFLCSSAVPQALRSRQPDRLVNLLQLLASWERILPLSDVSLLVGHDHPAVRAQLMRLLPVLPNTTENQIALQMGLGDPDVSVQAAAAAAARRLHLADAIPASQEPALTPAAVEVAC